jgi:4-amino-4-deoxy-L-arabinose transferase-like glycosyltransferase
MNETDGLDHVGPGIGTVTADLAATAATGPGTLEPTVDPEPKVPEWPEPSPAGPMPGTWTPEGTIAVDSPLDTATPGAEGTGPPTDPPTPAPPSGWLSRVVRGRPQDPAWVRPALVVLLVGTGFLYLWGLGASGWGNSFYSAAVQAGTKSWKAFFFGSSDASNFITVDKPPGSLWAMEISARIFGVNSWSILVPQALEGVATVGVVFVTIRRWFTPGAALLAGGVVALTPVATLMFRFNNPDALLTLLLSLAAYATFRAVENGRSRWMVLAGALIGFGFITKMLQAIILIPVLALVYLLAGPPKLGRRVVQVVYSGLAMVLAGGWWVAAVQLTPAADRPYIGGSTDNNLLNLIFGYNGFGRLTGNETGSVGGGLGGGGTGSMWGPVGWNRLFLREMGGQISWLIPGALIGLVAVLWLTRRAPRTDRIRAGFLVFGGWLLLTGATISFAHGIIHPYYTVALAPAIGALVGMGGSTLWRRRSEVFPRVALALAIVASVAWAFVILGWSPHWYPALRWVIVAIGVVAALGIALVPKARGVLAAGLAGFGIASIIAAPAAYSLNTAATPHSGAIPSAGPAIQGGSGLGGFGGPGGFRGAGALGRNGFTLPPGFTLPNGAKLPKGLHIPGSFFRRGGPGAAFAGGQGPGGAGRFGGGFAGRRGGGGGGGFGGGAAGGLLNGSTPGKQLTATLSADASRYTWVAAATGSNTASGYQLASGDPVMAIGGFNGTDPAPTLAQFEKYVSEGKIHYYISGGGFGGGFGSTGSSDSSQIASWVADHFTATTVDGVTLYNLTAPAS